MTPIGFSFLFFSSLTLLSIAASQERAPHGIANEQPVAFSPLAYDFFHPTARKPENITDPSCSASQCSPLPEAAQVGEEATQIYESNKVLKSQNGRKHLGAGGVAGIVFGVALAVLLAMGVYYVRAKRQANMTRANTVQPHA
ncbi:putative transmembrane protein [Senna tora]|uniref:Putative transmembrane protein n=1 Tax=Senna tora TaxID=362788 RepID=A0A834TM68_9FABA|nr:putative transmembrane protein [Senna tora]